MRMGFMKDDSQSGRGRTRTLNLYVLMCRRRNVKSALCSVRILRPLMGRKSTRSRGLAGVDRPIEVKIFGPDVTQLRDLAERVAKVVEQVDGTADVNANVHLGNPDVVIRPDSAQTERVGLTELDIEKQLSAALYGQVAGTIPEQDRMTEIRVRYPDRVRYDRLQLGQLPISLPPATRGGSTSSTPSAGGSVGAS